MAKKVQPQTPQNKWLKVSQFFAAYLVAAWTFLQFLDWILKRYNVSPHWVDLMLWLFIGIIPSLLIYLYNKDRLNNRVFRRREKIIFPLNAVVLAIVIYFGFGNNDLGATTQSVNYSTALGENKTALFTKEEFRTGFAIFNFEPVKKDSTRAWMEFGISWLLYQDLLQNKNLSPVITGLTNTTDKVSNAKLFYDSYVDGEFEITDSIYSINAFIRNSANAKVIVHETFKGNDLLNLIDEITIYVTNYFSPVKLNKPDYIDLNVKDFTSNSLKAIEYYLKGDNENAIKEDSTFALVYLGSAINNVFYSLSKFDERRLADKAYEYRYKLPIQKQGETLIWKNLAYDQFEKAEELVKIQLEIDPNNPTYKSVIYNIYGKTKNVKAYTDLAYKAWKNNHNEENGRFYLNACLIKGDYNKILKEIKTLELVELNNNTLFSLKMMPQLLKGDLKSASETQNKIRLLHPDMENLIKVYDKTLAYLKDHKITKEDLQKFEGEYRSNIGEMTITFWINNNTLLHYASNQDIMPTIMAGENTVITGHALFGQTFEHTFLKNKDNNYYALKTEENLLSQSVTYMWWKLDDTIKKAETLLEAGKLDSAEVAYTLALEANPNHYYLKDVLAHINYMKSIDSVALINQYKEVTGMYGPRKFWMEKGKLFYKRTDNKQLGQVQLLPISETRYINLTRMIDIVEFEYKDGKAIASCAWRFDCEKMEWMKMDDKGNYFSKDEFKPGAITRP